MFLIKSKATTIIPTIDYNLPLGTYDFPLSFGIIEITVGFDVTIGAGPYVQIKSTLVDLGGQLTQKLTFPSMTVL